jgi:thiol-disulfide isomerase/thioredoxin|tara:strand:- start:808 stop:1191 length:384 start_codon:yes stop_codon:yes gene_type:complete
MIKKLLILGLMITSLFSQVKELTDENFEKATRRGLVVVEFWATWNEANKVEILDDWSEDTFDAKVYRVNIELYSSIQSDNEVVILPTIIFYDSGEEVERLQGDMSFTLKVTPGKLDEIVEEILSNKF